MATLMDKVVEILGLRIKVSVEAVDDARAAPTAVPIDEPSLHKIIRSMSGRKPDMTTHFEIIGLEAVRRRYDLHWEQIEEKVHLVVSRIIGAHMQAGDSFLKISSSKYALTFVRTDAAAAKKRAADIRQKILDVFLSGELVGTRLDIQLDEPRSTVLPPVPRKEGAGRDAAGRPLFFRPSTQHAGIPCGVENLRAPKRPVLLRGEDGHAILPSGLRFLSRRIWDTALSTAAGQRFFFYLEMEGDKLFDYDVLPLDADDDMIAKMDMMMLSTVQQYLDKTISDDMPVRVVCPVHYRTVSGLAMREKYLQACRQMPDEVSKRYLAFEILHMPRALYGSALTDPIEALKKVGRGVILRCPLDHVAADTLMTSGATAVSTHCAHMTGRPPPSVEKQFAGFVRSCNKLKLRSYAFGLDSPELCDMAEKAGFGGLCGDGVLTKHPDK